MLCAEAKEGELVALEHLTGQGLDYSYQLRGLDLLFLTALLDNNVGRCQLKSRAFELREVDNSIFGGASRGSQPRLETSNRYPEVPTVNGAPTVIFPSTSFKA